MLPCPVSLWCLSVRSHWWDFSKTAKSSICWWSIPRRAFSFHKGSSSLLLWRFQLPEVFTEFVPFLDVLMAVGTLSSPISARISIRMLDLWWNPPRIEEESSHPLARSVFLLARPVFLTGRALFSWRLFNWRRHNALKILHGNVSLQL